MVERVGAAADIERVAVGEKRLAAERAHIVAHDARPVRAQIGHVARLTEVELDGDVLVLEIDLLKAGGFHEPAQLFERADLVRAQIGKIYFCRFHRKHLRSLISFSFPGGTDPPILFYCAHGALSTAKSAGRPQASGAVFAQSRVRAGDGRTRTRGYAVPPG